MKLKFVKRLICGLLVGVLAFGGSLTVMADEENWDNLSPELQESLRRTIELNKELERSANNPEAQRGGRTPDRDYRYISDEELKAGVTTASATTSAVAFDAEFYARTYPEVVAILGADKDVLYKHYIMYGKAEGRMGCAADLQQSVNDAAVFDAEFYARTYPDVVAVLGTDKDVLYSHYLMFGKAEGRMASAADVK